LLGVERDDCVAGCGVALIGERDKPWLRHKVTSRRTCPED
jgi:hypothetical protein